MIGLLFVFTMDEFAIKKTRCTGLSGLLRLSFTGWKNNKNSCHDNRTKSNNSTDFHRYSVLPIYS